MIPDTYPEALKLRDQVEGAYLDAVVSHRAACGTVRGPMGLTPDHVKATPEWKQSRTAMDRAQRTLAAFNSQFLKRYKTEWKATLLERRKSRN